MLRNELICICKRLYVYGYKYEDQQNNNNKFCTDDEILAASGDHRL